MSVLNPANVCQTPKYPTERRVAYCAPRLPRVSGSPGLPADNVFLPAEVGVWFDSGRAGKLLVTRKQFPSHHSTSLVRFRPSRYYQRPTVSRTRAFDR